MPLNKFISILLLFLFLFTSCKKQNKTSITPVIKPYVDTVALLTEKKWRIMESWSDSNQDSIRDSGEILPQYSLYYAYIFHKDGTINDTSISSFRQTGMWHFITTDKSTFKIDWTITVSYNPVFKILSITDTSMIWEMFNQNAYWYFKKS